MYRHRYVRLVIYGLIATVSMLIGATCALEYLGGGGSIGLKKLRSHSDFHTFLERFRHHTHSNTARYSKFGEALEDWERDTSSEYVMQLADEMSQAELPTVRHYDFEVSKVSSWINGIHRKLSVINGQYPGPLIEAVEGDTIVIHIVNRDYDSKTVLHFHGLDMNGSEHLDGVAGLTQCGIKPGETFTYEFVVKRTGTHWYHSHYDMQRVQGLLGPIVVHPRQRDYWEDHMGETAVLLTDLYDRDPKELMLSFQEPWIGGDEPIPSIALMQGKQLPIIPLESPTSRHKLRLINACTFTTIKISLDQHDMTIVSADGTPIQPARHSALVIYPGQRYDIVIRKRNHELTSSWLRAEVCTDTWTDIPGEYKQSKKISGISDVKGVLLYHSTVATNEPQEIFPNSRPKQDSNGDVEKWLVPLRPTIPPHPDVELKLMARMGRDENGEVIAAINDTSFLLHDYYQSPRLNAIAESWPRLLTTEDITVVDIVLQNDDDGPHPFHLHGGKFWIISRGENQKEKIYWTSMLPLERDTVWVPKGEWVNLRFIADNPGLWLFHCHIPWHSVIGMQGVFAVMPSRIPSPSQEWLDLC